MMFDCYNWERNREMRWEQEERADRIERASYDGYQSGQAAGIKEGEKIGYDRGWTAGKERGVEICLQILDNSSKAPKDLAEEFGLSIEIINKLLKYV